MGCDVFRLEQRPDLPFQAAGQFKANDGIPVPGKIRNGSMTSRAFRDTAAMPIWEAMNVKPVTADIHSDSKN